MSLSLKPIAFFSPVVVAAASTNIPASASSPLEVVADTGVQTGVGIYFNDTTGAIVGVYTGTSGHEQLLCVIGNGVTDTSFAPIPAHSRISIRNLQNSAVSTGLLSGTVMTN